MLLLAIVMQAINEGVAPLFSNRSCGFRQIEIGSQVWTSGLGLVGSQTCILPAKGVDFPFLRWGAHVKALKVKIWLQYRDGTRTEWKILLDQWTCRFFEQRGVPFSTIAPEYILRPL